MPLNFGGAGSGAASGALTGFGVGGGPGAAIGGILGGIGGLFSGNKDKNRQISTLTPEQKGYLKDLFGNLQGGGVGQNYGQANSYIGNLLSGDPEAYQKFAAPYMTQFEQQTVPGLAERFAGLGGGLGGGALSSSGFGQAIGGAGAQLQSNLAGLYAQLQQQAAQQAFGQYNTMAGYGLGTQAFQPAYQPGNLGFGGSALSGIFEGVGKGIGQQAGSGLSSRFAEMFNKNPAQQATPTG